MKLKYLFLAMLLPLSAFADKTNLFDTVRVQQRLWIFTNNVPDRAFVRGGVVIDGIDISGTPLTITNAPASGTGTINIFRSQNGRFFQANNGGGGASIIGYFDANFAGWGTLASHPFGIFIANGANSFQLNTSGNSVFSPSNANATANTNAVISAVGQSPALSVIDVVAAASQTVEPFRVRTSASANLVTVGPTGNVVSRGRGIVVSGLSAVTNTLNQAGSDTYTGAPQTVTFPIAFTSVPVVVATTTTASGSTILNDTIFITNKTTTTFVVGYRTAAGASSGATLTFDWVAIGLQ